MQKPTVNTPPGVVVILPTYRREAPLVWSLASVLAQRLEGLAIRNAKVVVVNNDTDKAAVEAAVRTAVADVGLGPWQLEVFHRDPPLDPVLSWYGAIEQFTTTGDVAFLQGDDDLLLRDSIAVRTRSLLESRATMLVSRAAGGVVFDAVDPAFAYLGVGFSMRRVVAAPAPVAGVADMDRYECAFIGNHAYRCTGAFFEAYRSTLARMEALPITGPHQRAMLPLLLSLEVCDRGGLAVTDALGAVRGQTRDEVVGARWGVANWSFGVLFGTVLAALDGPGWRGRADLDFLRNKAKEQLAYWYFAGMLDGRARAELRALGCAGIRQLGTRYSRRMFGGVGLILKTVTGTRGLRTRFFSNLERRARPELLEQLRTAEP